MRRSGSDGPSCVFMSQSGAMQGTSGSGLVPAVALGLLWSSFPDVQMATWPASITVFHSVPNGTSQGGCCPSAHLHGNPQPCSAFLLSPPPLGEMCVCVVCCLPAATSPTRATTFPSLSLHRPAVPAEKRHPIRVSWMDGRMNK